MHAKVVCFACAAKPFRMQKCTSGAMLVSIATAVQVQHLQALVLQECG